MKDNHRQHELLETAHLGIEMERLQNEEAFQSLLESLQRSSQSALERCLSLSPYKEDERAELADTLGLARGYNLVLAKIDSIVHAGRQAQAALDERKPFADE